MNMAYIRIPLTPPPSADPLNIMSPHSYLDSDRVGKRKHDLTGLKITEKNIKRFKPDPEPSARSTTLQEYHQEIFTINSTDNHQSFHASLPWDDFLPTISVSFFNHTNNFDEMTRRRKRPMSCEC